MGAGGCGRARVRVWGLGVEGWELGVGELGVGRVGRRVGWRGRHRRTAVCVCVFLRCCTRAEAAPNPAAGCKPPRASPPYVPPLACAPPLKGLEHTHSVLLLWDEGTVERVKAGRAVLGTDVHVMVGQVGRRG